ncbi:hypothetical protein ACO0LM_22340 [Undibacterium sp. Di26W]|uniref:hypothetical protein n=1 Tax=Undibacterium sp. Di26W TaxID=3413035 RepID=UPI003BF42FCA
MTPKLLMEEPYTRTVVDPTGHAHEITLSGWYWACLDWLHAETDYTDAEIIRLSWDGAKQMEAEGTMRRPGDLAFEFSESLRLTIWIATWGLINKAQGLSNDNWG